MVAQRRVAQGEGLHRASASGQQQLAGAGQRAASSGCAQRQVANRQPTAGRRIDAQHLTTQRRARRQGERGHRIERRRLAGREQPERHRARAARRRFNPQQVAASGQVHGRVHAILADDAARAKLRAAVDLGQGPGQAGHRRRQLIPLQLGAAIQREAVAGRIPRRVQRRRGGHAQGQRRVARGVAKQREAIVQRRRGAVGAFDRQPKRARPRGRVDARAVGAQVVAPPNLRGRRIKQGVVARCARSGGLQVKPVASSELHAVERRL